MFETENFLLDEKQIPLDTPQLPDFMAGSLAVRNFGFQERFSGLFKRGASGVYEHPEELLARRLDEGIKDKSYSYADLLSMKGEIEQTISGVSQKVTQIEIENEEIETELDYPADNSLVFAQRINEVIEVIKGLNDEIDFLHDLSDVFNNLGFTDIVEAANRISRHAFAQQNDGLVTLIALIENLVAANKRIKDLEQKKARNERLRSTYLQNIADQKRLLGSVESVIDLHFGEGVKKFLKRFVNGTRQY